MKKLFVLSWVALLLFLAMPDRAAAQSPANWDENPCFALLSGPCVTFPDGKIRACLTLHLIRQANLRNRWHELQHGKVPAGK